MADPKYQIFVSSTFTDLIDARQQAIRAILSAGHIPSGMEWFPASPEEQFEFIKPIIDQCDYYVLIVGGKYGSISPITGLSYTEMEFDYALGINKHILVFPHRSPQTLPGDKLEETDAGREALKVFRKKAMSGRVASLWSDGSELRANVQSALVHAFKSHPQLGWVRADTPTLGEENSARRRREKKLIEEKLAKTETLLVERLTEISDLRVQLAKSETRLMIKDSTLSELEERVRAQEGISIATALQTERLAGSPPSPELVAALDRTFKGSFDINEGISTGAGHLPAPNDITHAASRKTPSYETEWQAQLFEPIDRKLHSIEKQVQNGNAAIGVRLLLPVIERLLKYTFLNVAPKDGTAHTSKEYISKLSASGLSSGSVTELRSFFDCYLRLALQDTIPPNEFGETFSGALRAIGGLKSLWRTANYVLQADVPLFGQPNGTSPWGETKGLIIRRHEIGKASKTEYCVRKGSDISTGDFVTWLTDRQTTYGAAYYRHSSDEHDLFNSGANPFTGIPIRFEKGNTLEKPTEK